MTGRREDVGRRAPVSARVRALCLLLAAAAYAAVGMATEPFTWQARVATALPVAVLVGFVVQRGWHRRGPLCAVPPVRRTYGVGLLVWGGVIGLLGGFQMLNFNLEPREIHPTLSSLVRIPLMHYPIRVTAFVLWLWLGWYLATRSRRVPVT